MARSVILPVCLCIGVALALLCGSYTFVHGGATAKPALRVTAVSTRALPLGAEVADTSLTSAMVVSEPGWFANIIFLVVPITFLITLYLQSERTLREEEGL